MTDSETASLKEEPLPKAAVMVKRTLAFSLTSSAVIWAADIPSRLGFAFYTEQFLAVVLGLSLALVFLIPRGFSETNSSGERLWAPSRLDWLLSMLGLSLCLWIAFRYADFLARAMLLPWDGLFVAALLFTLILEGLRRAVGWTLVIVVFLICGYGLIGHLVPGALQTREVAPERMLLYLGFDPNGLLGLTLMVASTVVVAFVFFGQLLLKSGGADFFNDIALAAMGRRRGGSAKISIVASGLFGSISGVVVSNIVATGVVTIRLMTQSGFKRHTAAAIEAVASTGGQIVPPVMGAVAFLMADILQKPYAEIVVAAIVPAFLYYVAVFVQADLQAARDDIAPVDPALIPKAGKVLRTGWVFILPFAAVVIALFWFNQRPETAALWGAGTALLIGLTKGYDGKRMTFRDLMQAMIGTGNSIVDIIMIAAAAGFIIGCLNVTGLGFGLTFTLVALGEGSLLLLLLVCAAVCIVLGMGMPTVGVYLLLAVLVAPSLIQSGVEPIAAHLFIFYLGMMSMVTPPVGIGAFFAASIAGARPMQTAFTAMRFGWTAYIIPFLFVFSPALTLKGSWPEILLSVATASLGVFAVSAGFVGYVSRRAGTAVRMGAVASGALLLVNQGIAGSWAPWLNAIGLFGFVSLYILQSRLGTQKVLSNPGS